MTIVISDAAHTVYFGFMIRTIAGWCKSGFFAVAVFGWLLHDVYSWSQQNLWVAIVAPVNESVWEHLKLGVGGVILFSIIEYPFIRKMAHNYITAKVVGIIVVSITILTVYYTYSSIFGRSILWLDIGSFAMGVLLAQGVCFHFFLLPDYKILNRISLGVLMMIIIIFAWCTFHPPAWPIFQDNRLHSYGIPTMPGP